jgi:hypothetical protein
VDAASNGVGLQSLTLVSSSNASVNIPAFPIGTFDPVTATFTVQNAGQPVDFTLRASARRQAVEIRAQCSAPSVARGAIMPDVSFWLPAQAAGSLDGIVSLVRYALRPAELEVTEGN